LYLAILIKCRKILSQSEHLDCKIIKLDDKEKFFGGVPGLLPCFELG
jgi:hypothetical protein